MAWTDKVAEVVAVQGMQKFSEAIHPYEADPVTIGEETDYTVELRKWKGKVDDEQEKEEDPTQWVWPAGAFVGILAVMYFSGRKK